MIEKKELIIDTNSFSKFNNKSINNLGNNIKWLIFPYDSTFNMDISNISNISSQIEFLSLGKNFTKSLKNLSPSLKYFIYMGSNYNSDIANLPETIKYFGLKTSSDMILSKLPQITKYLELDTFINQNILISNNNALDNLPNPIEIIKLFCCYYSELKNLPSNTKELIISNLCTLNTLYYLPKSLLILEIFFRKYIFNSNEDKNYFSNLPQCLKKLFIKSDCTNNLVLDKTSDK